MQKVKNKKALIGILAVFLSGILVGVVYAQAISQTHIIDGGIYPNPASYTIWSDGLGTYYAKNSYGALAYTGTNAATVINNCFSSLPTPRLEKERVVLIGDIFISSTLLVPSWTILQIDGVLWLSEGANVDMIYLNAVNDVELYGHMNGKDYSQTNASACGIRLTTSFDCKLDVYVEQVIGTGIQAEHSFALIIDAEIDECDGDGLLFHASNAFVNMVVATENGLNGVKLQRHNDTTYCQDITINYVFSAYNQGHGLIIENAIRTQVLGGTLKDNSQAGVGVCDGLALVDNGALPYCSDNMIANLMCIDDQGSATQRYGIKETHSSDYTTIINVNARYGNTESGIYSVGANSKINDSWNASSWIS